MLIAICAGIFLILVSILSTILIVSWKIRSFKSEIITFFTAPDEKTPSPFAQLVEVMSHTAGHAIAMEVKTTIMGKASGIARGEQAITEAIAQDTLTNQSPVAGMLMNAFPTLGKKILRSPGLLDMAMSLLSRYAANKGNGSHPAQGTGFQSTFKL